MGVDGSGLSRSERGVCFIDVVGVGAGRSQWWVQLPVNVIRRGRNVRSRAPATDWGAEIRAAHSVNSQHMVDLNAVVNYKNP